MPKREKTPPPPDDEPRYLTVVHPYPLNANLMLHADRRKLALWLACCTGKDVLLAMYHKPTSPGMVIIEVDRDFEQFEMLLGKHDWSKFLSKPSKEEEDKSSKVFWCHYNSGRLVQKHGWKRVDIEEHWFTGWSNRNNVMKFPYPKSTYCDVPSEAQTGVPLCRPLPKAQFPVPPPAPKPPVGSAEWNHAKSSDTASVTTSSSRKGRGKNSGPSDSVSMISSASVTSSYSRAAQPRQPPAAPPVPPSQVAGYRAKQGAWRRGPPSTASTSIASPPPSRAPSTIGSGRGSRAHSVRAPAKPPGLTMEYQRFNWADDLDRYEEEQDDEPPTPPASSSSINLGSGRRPPDPEGPIDPDQDYEYQDDDRPKRSISVAMKDVFDGAENADDLPPATWGINNGIEPKDDPEPWIGYDAPKWEAPTKINRKGPDREEWQCPDHGPMCNPGICKERAELERERRWLKEHEERMENKRIRDEKREKKKLREAEKLARAEEGASSDGDSNSNSTGSEMDRDGSRKEDKHPPANPDTDDWSGNKPLSDDDDDEAPKVNLGPGHCAPSVSTSYDEGRQRLSPAFPDDDGRSFKSAWTRSTGTSAKKDNVSRGTAGGRQPSDARSVAASVRSAASSSAWSDAPISSRSSVSGQRNSDWDTRSAASSHLTAPSMSNGQATRGNEVASISSSQRQRSGKPRSPSVHTTTSSVVSGRPTETYAASISQSSRASAKQPSERDSRSSATLPNTSSSTRSKRSTGTDQSSQSSIAEWRQKTSVACSSTGPRTPVSSRSPTPTDGRSVARSSTSARTAVSSRSSAPTDGGFPTFEHTKWADPITASQNERRKSSGRSNSKKEAEAESDDSAAVETEKKASESAQNAGSGKKYRGWNKNRGGKAKPAAKKVDAPQPQEDSLSVAAGYNPRPGGPGSKWGDTNAEW